MIASLSHYWQMSLNTIQYHQHWGEFLAFLFAFLESLPIVGTIIPGSITMTAIGVLIGTRILPAGITIMWASIGAFAGDFIGYWLGRRYTRHIENWWPFNKKRHWLESAENFIARYGIFSIVIGRFFGPMRSAMPMVAGLLSMRALFFYMAAIPSAVMWAILYMTPGILMGSLALDIPHAVMGRFVMYGFMFIVFIWAISWLYYKSQYHIISQLKKYSHDLWSKYAASNAITYRYLHIKNNLESGRNLFFFIVALMCLCLFFIIGLFDNSRYITEFNSVINALLRSVYHRTWADIFIFITFFGEKIVLASQAVLLIAYLAYRKEWSAIKHFIALGLILVAVLGFCKIFIFHLRPHDIMYVAHSSSFPSGHVALFLGFFGFYIMLLTNAKSQRYKMLAFSLCYVISFLVAFSRLYLGAHWLSDVVAGLLLGTVCILFSSIAWSHCQGQKSFGAEFFSTILLSFVLCWGGFSLMKYHSSQKQYQPIQYKLEITMQQWWNHPKQYLPIYRKNRLGISSWPLNIEWAGNLKSIALLLQHQGWQILSTRVTIKSVMRRLSDLHPQWHRPLFPQLYHNHVPSMVLYKASKEGKPALEIILWPSDVVLIQSHVPLWVGTISYHYSPKELLTLNSEKLSYYRVDSSVNIMPRLLHNQQWKLLDIEHPLSNYFIKRLLWNGKIIMIRPKGYL